MNSQMFDALPDDGVIVEIGSTGFYYTRISNYFKSILKEVHEPLNQWKQNPRCSEEMLGVVVNNKWHRLNTPETNSRGQFFLFKQCNIFLNSLKEKGLTHIVLYGHKISTDKIFIGYDWKSDPNFEEKLNNLLRIIRYNANEWLVPGTPVCVELMKICYECMLVGDTAELLTKMYLYEIEKNIKTYEFTEGLGDCRDIKEGTDCWIYDTDDNETTYQIKYKYFTRTQDYIKTDAKFSWYSRCNYFILVYKNTIVKIKNDKSINIKKGKEWSFPINNCEFYKTINMFEELKSLMRVTGNNDIVMNITRDNGENEVSYDSENKIVTINFTDTADEEFKTKIVKLTSELQKLFQ